MTITRLRLKSSQVFLQTRNWLATLGDSTGAVLWWLTPKPTLLGSLAMAVGGAPNRRGPAVALESSDAAAEPRSDFTESSGRGGGEGGGAEAAAWREGARARRARAKGHLT